LIFGAIPFAPQNGEASSADRRQSTDAARDVLPTKDTIWTQIPKAVVEGDATFPSAVVAGLSHSACGLGYVRGSVCLGEQTVHIGVSFFSSDGLHLGSDAAYFDLDFLGVLVPYIADSPGSRNEDDELQPIRPYRRGISEAARQGGEEGMPATPASKDQTQRDTRDEKRSPEWAATQHAIGTELLEQGTETVGAPGLRLIADAVAAYRRTLTAYSRETQPHAWAMTQNSLGLALSHQGARTADPEGLRLLAEAADAYRKALGVYTREEFPRQWATTQNNLGTVLREHGPRVKGEAGQRLLAEAVAVYREALAFRSREEFPQEWASTQNNLGIALRNLGTRIGGQAGERLLGEAVISYREALSVRTRDALPERWAATQLNLGIALQEQSIHAEGEEWRRLVTEAQNALKAALEVIDSDNASPRMLQIQMNLLTAYEKLGDDRGTVAVLERLLESQPDNEKFYHAARNLYHNVLFEFGAAYRLTSEWLERHPDEFIAQCYLAETLFTTSRFPEAEEQLAALIGSQKLSANSAVSLRVLAFANTLALGKPAMALKKLGELAALVTSEPMGPIVQNNFAGTTHYIANAPELATSRVTVLALVRTVEGGDMDALLTALAAAEKDLSGRQ
jgi:tetratricopeptide (TPR) repeat protein